MNEDIALSTCAFPPSGSQELGIIYGVSCFSSNFFRDTAATVRNLTVGGELEGYTSMISKGVEVSEQRLRDEARKLGADGVFGVRIATPQVAGGAAEVIMYGTAYRYLASKNAPSQ